MLNVNSKLQSAHQVTCLQWEGQKTRRLSFPPNFLALRASCRLSRVQYGEPLARRLRSANKRASRGTVKICHSCISATARPLNVDLDSLGEDAGVQAGVGWSDALYRFSRPRTIVGSVNKPYLPLASGEFSLNTGIALVTISAALVPLLRWKRSAVAAASCILAVRAVVVQLGFYLHMQTSVFGRSAALTRPLWFTIGFMSFFSIVIALAKDIPDIKGDKIFGIRTFSVGAGQEKVFWMCVGLLQAAHASACVIGVTPTVVWSRIAMVLGHIALATILWDRSQSVTFKSRASITSWYVFIRRLFYAE